MEIHDSKCFECYNGYVCESFIKYNDEVGYSIICPCFIPNDIRELVKDLYDECEANASELDGDYHVSENLYLRVKEFGIEVD